MKTRGLKTKVFLAWLGMAHAQTPTVAPSSVSFSYQMGASAMIQQQKVVVTLPAANASQTLTTSNVVVQMYQVMGAIGTNICSLGYSNTGCGWLSVTPSQGHSPLTLMVTGNPSTLTAGSYSGYFTVTTTTAPFNPVIVTVLLSISNPPSKLAISSQAFPLDASSNQIPSLAFTYTTSDAGPAPASALINVSSTGDIIPFTVTVANVASKGSGSGTVPVWLRVAASGGNGLPSISASSSAFPGSYVGVTVTLDYASIIMLDPAGSPYNGTITIAAINAVNGSFSIPVSLNIAAGAPSITSVFPTSVNAQLTGTTPTNNYIFTLVGDNFFTTTAVSLQQGVAAAPVGPSISLPQPTYLSRQVLQVTINPAYFTVPQSGGVPVNWFLKIANPAPATNPGLPPVTVGFSSVDPTQPNISGVVNAASYQQASVWSGTGQDPLLAHGTVAVAPREIVSIFGQNLGPAAASTAQPLPVACPGVVDGSTNCLTYGTTWGDNITVTFSYQNAGGQWQTRLAPILMTSMNQINAIVPKEVAEVLPLASQQVQVNVTNGTAATQVPFLATVIAENPGMFTFGGLGQGQGAVINYDSTGTITSVNSSKNTEPRGDTVAIFVTGMGVLTDDTPLTGDVIPITSAPNPVFDQTVRVDIGGQPCVVTYAGAAPLAVAGLVQINAVVTPSAKAGSNDAVVVSIGPLGAARSSQSGVTIGVK
ncbi:exported hypothetical protein [Candidatus Sulfopaludibacter sp. SbA3]|nr:exported hypothetical protein [Candidatus Sulfopaludibacter sp. SbA3]